MSIYVIAVMLAVMAVAFIVQTIHIAGIGDTVDGLMTKLDFRFWSRTHFSEHRYIKAEIEAAKKEILKKIETKEEPNYVIGDTITVKGQKCRIVGIADTDSEGDVHTIDIDAIVCNDGRNGSMTCEKN